MKKQFSLRTRIIIILVTFIIFILSLIALFQTVFLDDFYINNKKQMLQEISHTVSENLESEDLESVLRNMTLSNEVCVRISSKSFHVDGYGKDNACALGMMDPQLINIITNDVKNAGGEKLIEDWRISMGPKDQLKMYAYGQIVNLEGEDVLVLVSSVVTPLTATLMTIREQYLAISLIVIAATVVLALILSKVIIRPVKDISNEVIKLPQGHYDGSNVDARGVEFEQLNDNLSRANEEIIKAEKAKRELLANVSHDLRTPLTMIVGYGEMMKDMPSEKTDENIDVIIGEAKRLSDLVNDLIELSTMQSGKMNLSIDKFKANDYLKNIYSQYKKYCESNGVKFKLQLDEDFMIEADDKRITQVLYNFINNAIHYNNKEEKEVTLGSEKIPEGHRIYVLDNGNGLREEDISKVWDRYYKVDKEHKRSSSGSGIGLALSREILMAHELNYGVESEYGKYSKFYFDVPVIK